MNHDIDLKPIGLTIASFQGLGAHAMIAATEHAASLGAASVWTAETTGAEAFATLAALAPHAPGRALGTGIIPMQIRTPLLATQGAATLRAFAPESEVLLGVGISSPVVVCKWHGAQYGSDPIGYSRDYLRLLRRYLDGETVSEPDQRSEDLSSRFSLSKSALRVRFQPPSPRIVLGALNRRMLRLAGELADGVLLNYLPASAVPWCVEQVRSAETAAGRPVGACRVYAYVHVGVCDPDRSFALAQKDLFSYAVVDGYARAFARAGFDEEIDALRAAMATRDRESAVAAISRRMAGAIDICGDPATVTNAVRDYFDAGVDHAVVMPLPWRPDREACIAETIDAALAARTKNHANRDPR